LPIKKVTGVAQEFLQYQTQRLMTGTCSV